MSFRLLTYPDRTNFRHLYGDILWFGVLSGSTMAFLAIYATRLGANDFQVSLLTAGPAVMNLLFSLPAGSWLRGRSLVRTTFWAAVLYRLGYVALIPLPWLFLPHSQIWLLVGITVVMAIPGTYLAIGFNAMFADVVASEWRGEVVGRRNAVMAASYTATAILCGQLLDRIDFPLNYQVVFGLGVLGAALSTYHIGQVCALQRSPYPNTPPSKGNHLVRFDLLSGSFGPFMAAYLFFYTSQYIAIPLFPLYYVNQLNLKDSAISLGGALFYIVTLLLSLRLGRLSQRFGHKKVLVSGALALSIYPLLIGLARDATLFWVASLVGGGVYGVITAGLLNRLMEVVPEDDRPPYMALHNLVLNLGMLAGSLVAPVLSQGFGLREAIYISAGLRLIAGVSLLVFG
jgi:MFS family permease